MKKLITPLVFLSIALCSTLIAQAQLSEKSNSSKKFSLSSSADASIFQIALTEIAGQSEMSTLRFSYFFNGGSDLNYELSNGLSIYSGFRIRNMGLILKENNSTHKYRTYTIGLPLGLKIKTKGKQNLIVGGGVDFPFNYKEKHWVDGRKNKIKSNEWFSNKVNPVMPYMALGYNFKPIVLKVLYYPTNFWSDSYTNSSANIIALTLGFDINKKGKGGKNFKLPKAVEGAAD